MDKLFPIVDIRKYMWEHLASTLLGTSVNQTFHMYIGKGRNGKSVLMDLMSKVLGDYKGDVPLSIITAGRTKPGGLNPELVELKGVRYAVMQEPSPDEKINVGPMKMLTSGKDKIQCRAPYMPEMVSYNPQFKLCVCSNTLMKVESQDDGTWRRIRVVDFVSLFTENPVQGDPLKPYQYKVEYNIDEKFESWKEIFISLLINIAKVTKGAVKDCEQVLASSNSYKNEQDIIGIFAKEKIVADPGGKIIRVQLKAEFDKWYNSMYDERSRPKAKELYDFFERIYGKTSTWRGISIVRNETSEYGGSDHGTVVDDEDFSTS
jgi:P4 family phage/plasmid primase-like protien